jgi:hypothetical protein
MELHPDAYADPETENNWVLPQLPHPLSVPDNTSSFSVFYFWRGKPNPRQKRVSVALTREILPPWRRGAGIMWRWSHQAYALGVWTPGQAPRILSDSPEEKDWQQVVARANSLESGSERN